MVFCNLGSALSPSVVRLSLELTDGAGMGHLPARQQGLAAHSLAGPSLFKVTAHGRWLSNACRKMLVSDCCLKSQASLNFYQIDA
jgi:hypothetical protein